MSLVLEAEAKWHAVYWASLHFQTWYCCMALWINRECLCNAGEKYRRCKWPRNWVLCVWTDVTAPVTGAYWLWNWQFFNLSGCNYYIKAHTLLTKHQLKVPLKCRYVVSSNCIWIQLDTNHTNPLYFYWYWLFFTQTKLSPDSAVHSSSFNILQLIVQVFWREIFLILVCL